MNIKTKIAKFTKPLYLESGRILEPWQIIYETYGELNEDKSNAILITHALSGSHHAAGWYKGDRKPGWWDGLIGDSKAIDTTKYFVICTNVIGSCFGSTSPMSPIYPGSNERYRLKFPVITIKDMVKAQKILLDSLGIKKLKAVVGGSMGGMQALRFGVDFPGFVENIIPIATTYQTRPYVIAINKSMIEAIRADCEFKNGNYEIGKELKGLAVARMIGYLNYISPKTFDKKFGREYVKTDGMFELFGRFQVESYLEYNGAMFPKWFDALSYIYLLKAISLFDIGRGFNSLDEAFSNIKDKLFLISFSGDTLFFPEEMREIKKYMDKVGGRCQYYEIDSDYGHDSFLVEIDKFSDLISDILKGEMDARF
ncbi:homoserine O-acetyltransferase MetX [Caminibacter mediatlanticus]|uniref:Homoserine O-acetyltransferase n=1 Tax=Caminibacter mediatlanticus TB-2 TaxID=391592 RepID=A0AAI9AIP0_9BACT|nr:homoserine O-acetyltransferase [Caminibacter mediatlanticus]EDM24189.1 homoserine o-acetyltransferase protein [Caminibacter mediatlanticus TB-2]